MSARPHISPALSSLRGWVTAAAGVVAGCALLQLCIFAVAHFTDVRATHLEGAPNEAIVVKEPVEAAVPPPITLDPVAKAPKKPLARRGENALRGDPQRPHEPIDPNRVTSVVDRNLELTSSVASSAGLIAAFLLAAFTSLGVVVAGGAAVPGIHLTVRSCALSFIILGLGLPWSGIAGRSMVPGVFCGYAALVDAAESAGGFPVFMNCVMLPIIVLCLGGTVILSFRRGVQAGLILTSLSEIDEALEQEMAEIRKRGVGRLAPGQARAVGALSQTLPDDRLAAVDDVPLLRKAAGAESMTHEPDMPANLKRRRSGDFEQPMKKRPI